MTSPIMHEVVWKLITLQEIEPPIDHNVFRDLFLSSSWSNSHNSLPLQKVSRHTPASRQSIGCSEPYFPNLKVLNTF